MYEIIEFDSTFAIALNNRVVISGIETRENAEWLCRELNREI
jgi:hypothetical protein